MIGDILGKILCRNPGQKLAEVDLSATVSGSISPSINENWYLDLNSLGAKANITDAKLRILCFPRFSLRSKLQKEADEWAKSQLTKLKNRIAKDTNIKRSAQRAWKSICGIFPVDKETNLWLEINPLFARTSRVKIDDKTITLQVGVDVRSRLGDKETNPSCSFPNKLLIDQPRKGAFNIGLAGDIPYSLIDSQLRKATIGKESKGMVRVVVRDIGIGAYGQSILLQVRLSLKPEHWWRAGAEGTIFLTAVPTLRVTDQAIVLDDIQLDVDSRNVLVEVAGEVAAPVIVALLRRHNVVDLREFMDGTLRSRANRAFRGLSTQEFKVEGGVEDIRLTSLAVGPESIRLAARARGTVSVDVERLRKPAQ